MTRRGLILFVLMSLIWGIPYLFIRIAVDEISPAVLVFGRTTIAAAVLLPVALLRTNVRAALVRWRWVAAFAAIEMGLPWILLGTAEQQITSSLAALLVAGVPLVATVIAVASGGRDRVGPTGLLGLLIGLAGVAAIVGVNVGASNVAALLGMIVVVVGYALGPAILARRLSGVSNVAVMALSISLCALVYAPIAFLQRPTTLPSPAAISAVVILGLVCTAAAFLVFWALIEEIGPVRSTVITYLNPAVAALLGVTVLNETFTPVMAAGFGLVILGSALATRPAGAHGLLPEDVAEGPEADTRVSA